MAENRDSSERQMEIGSSNPAKVEQVRNIAGGTLVRTVGGQQTRFMVAPVQTPAAVISTTATLQTQVLTKVQGSGVPNQANLSRISTIPMQASATSYHVPRGAAAVANIAVPRSSVATPIVRAPSTLQTMGVTPQHTITGNVGGGGGGLVGRPVLGVTPWLGVATTCLPAVQTSTTRHAIQQIRAPPITVGSRGTQQQQQQMVRPLSDASTCVGTARPVLLHTTTTTHKQVTLTQQTQLQVTDKTVLKGYSGQTARLAGATPTLPRITTTLPPAMVSLHSAAVLVPSPAAALPVKTNTPHTKVISQPAHGATMQISSVPASSAVQSAIAISTVVTRPVMIGSNVGGGAGGSVVRSAPVGSKLIHSSGGASNQGEQPSPSPALYIHAQTHKAQQGAGGVGGSFYESSFQMATSRAPPTSTATGTTIHQQRTLAAAHIQGGQNTDISIGALALTTMASLTPKQNTSPRPSILRKRDPEGSPLKAQKNLNPVLSGLTVSTPCSPPSPPKRPESGNSGQSSGGSTTISATSSPGQGDPESPPIKQEPPHDEERAPPPEMSPRKKPRKQQLTGNQINEPTFSEDEMEFISDDKIKRDMKEELHEETDKCVARRTMSLLNSYKHNWKARNNHFVRYTDVKVKEDRKPTLTELANQKQALQKLNGWKIYHLGSQMEDMVNSETEFFGMYSSLLSFLELKQRKSKNKDLDKDMNRVNERIKANFQRSKVVKDQMLEAKSQVLKLFDHKGYVTDIITRSASKRSLKKRERV